jgi:DNA-binding response OmpR family regulator
MNKTDNLTAPAVLLVEDDRIVAAMVKHLLARQGYEVQSVGDGRAASALIDEINAPRLVILDVMLPFVDGFELISHIKSKPEWGEVPIIMLTSKTQERNVVRALESGADDYIVKPFQPQELIARVRRFVK